MQVLGSLLKLPEAEISLPLPWWHRSVLGLDHGTPVYVVLLKSENRPVGDLIITVLDPARWDRMKVLEGEDLDQPGVIEKVFEAVFPLNIAIAETVTIEAGNKHHICLFLEPVGDQDVKDEDILRNLEARGLHKFQLTPYMKTAQPIVWQTVGQVDHGWLRGIDWKDRMAEHFSDSYAAADLNKFVVSADTEKRILRYVFPLKGALFIKIEHADIPGALKVMTDCLVERKLNVLSASLTRGGAKPHNAILRAICEPVKGEKTEKLESSLKEKLRGQDNKFRIEIDIHNGEDASRMIFPHHPDEQVARVPNTLRPLVQEYQKQLPPGKLPVFISRRFMPGDRLGRIVKRIRDILVENGCEPVEAQPEPGQGYTTHVQVSAKMWIAKAGIVLMAKGERESISMNLVHEAGFLNGQGKEVLILIEEGAGEDMVKWSNAYGVVAPHFPSDDRAFNPDDPDSIDQLLTKWIRDLNKKIEGKYM